MEALLVRAANPSPYTLDGTNTWVLGRDPAWVVDPGPALPEHLDAVAAVVADRGGGGGTALTPPHPPRGRRRRCASASVGSRPARARWTSSRCRATATTTWRSSGATSAA